MSRHTPIDRFTLPKDIPDLAPNLAPGEIPSPTDACWSQPSGGDPLDDAPVPTNTPATTPSRPKTSAPDGEAARGYVMRSAAGRGWAPEGEMREPVTMVEGLPCTAEDLRLREAGEALRQAQGERARAARAQSRPGPVPLLTPARQAAFCSALAEHGNVRLACRAVQVSPQTAYRARRASYAFRQCWDAALVLARDHAEQVLADRALNGVEEKVFYHGEEVATRTRYSDRLLLAHLARLDKRAEEREVCDDCRAPLMAEEHFDEAVEALEGGEGEGPEFASGQCSMCSTFAADEAAQDGPPVPLEQRLAAMQAALPPDAQAQSGMTEAQWRWAEPERLCAYEAGEGDWWLARPEEVSAAED
ncbi:hypothetical protein [Aurantiacibacter odishensis]|uniref:hypothetical protein n=1 Tax=Aurantiacibacter odishensis TaxID=1155476 RepID=UPI00196ACBA8|nr:hypothetical protein [Aurantiacibacter odishensis]